MIMYRFLAGFFAAFALSLVAACGGDSSGLGGNEAKLVSIQVTPAAVSKAIGLTQPYSAIGTYSSGPNRDITLAVDWSSCDVAKVSINGAGLATAKALGASNITASLGAIKSNTATFTVTSAELVSIQITPAAVSKAAGLTQQYTALGTYTDGSTPDITTSVVWRSGNVAAVSVTPAGLATGQVLGTSAITASLGAVTFNAGSFAVTAATLVAIHITPAAVSKAMGLTQQYTATGTYTDGSTPNISASVSWNSSDTAKARISTSGLATAVAVGSTSITAVMSGIISNPGNLTVTAAALVSIQVSPANASKAVGLTQQYTAIGTYTDGSTPDISASVSWNSSDTAKATISMSGLATAVAVGSSNITAMMGGINSNSAALSVTAATLVSIQITPAIAKLAVGKTQQYTATGTYTDGSTPDISTTVSWNSSDTAKATISTSGLATGVAVGASNISASLNGLTSNIATLTVAAPAESAGPMNTARYNHTATQLADGKVLVTGGDGGAGTLASSELYDPLTGAWTTTGSMSTARVNHATTLLANGKVLVTGGYNGEQAVASSELYDPSTGTWTATGSLGAARDSHTATLLTSGKVLVAGGFNNAGTLASSELYDPSTGDWTASRLLNTARYFHTATLLTDGMVLVTGGASNIDYFASSELYDPSTDRWTTTTGSLGAARQLHTATLLTDGRVLVTGGENNTGTLASYELYNPSTKQWSTTGSLGAARDSHTATLLPGGGVLVTGGKNNTGSLVSSELYNLSTDSWTDSASLSAARELHTATLMAGGRVLIAGGKNSTGILAGSELYTP